MNPDTAQHRSYLHEAELLAAPGSPFILKLIGLSATDPFFLAIEYDPRATLSTVIVQDSLSGTRLTRIAMGIASAMVYFHKEGCSLPGLTPANIIITDQYLPKVSYFDASEGVKWTPPELFDGHEYDQKCDMFNYAMILHHLLVKRDSFANYATETVSRIICVDRKRPKIPSDTPPALSELITQCWSQDPKYRPSFGEIYAKFSSRQVFFAGCDLNAIQKFSDQLKTKAKDSPVSSKRKRPHPADSDWSDEGPAIPAHSSLNIYQNTRDPNFLAALDSVNSDLNDGDYDAFFGIMGRILRSESPQVIVAVLRAIYKLTPRESARNSIAKLRLVSSFPLDDKRYFDPVLEILHPLFTHRPEIFESGFGEQARILIKNQPLKTLILFSLFAKAFSDLNDPYELLDVLFDCHTQFVDGKGCVEYISLVFYLASNYPGLRRERATRCGRIFASFLGCTDDIAVQMAYKAICTFYDDSIKIPIERLISDITDRKRSVHALSTLMRMQTVPIRADLIEALLDIAQTRAEATLLLITMVRNSVECARVLLRDSRWMVQPLPTLDETLRLFLAIMSFDELRDAISQRPEVPGFLLNEVRANDPAAIVCLGSICKRIEISEAIIGSLSRMHFFTALCHTVRPMADRGLLHLGIAIVSLFATHGFCTDFLDITSFLKDCLSSANAAVARNALVALGVLSRYRDCAVYFKRLRIDADVRELFTDDADRKKVQKFLQNLQAQSRD
jgi:serine/threonine protein kinase